MASLPQIIAYGQTAEVFAHDGDRVLKLFRAGVPAALIDDEYRIAMRVFDAGIATPEPYEIVEAYGRRGIVFRRIAGESMLQAIMRAPGQLERSAAQMAELHAAVHRLDAPEVPSQRESLMRRILEAPLLSDDEKSGILAQLTNLPEEAKLCHGDFHPDNVLVSDRPWIIDWMTGTSGNPAGDAARTLLLLRLGSMPPETPADVVAAVDRMRERLLGIYTEQYLRLAGMRMEDIEPWIVPVAAARLVEWLPAEEKQQLVRLIRDSLSGGRSPRRRMRT